ncbi:MAG: hypothetical protein N2316_09230 [Spirochaetes bacterium]|nr:hypothetical protein [Spirochaetota bacterium]
MSIRMPYLFVLLMGAGIASFAFYVNTTVRVLEENIPGFTSIRDDELARQFAPTLISNSNFGFPHACYYRAARDSDGNIHLAYHPVWEYERNESSGIMPFLSRILYTGGLSIQRIMFGKGDVEVISAIISPKGQIIGIQYERPKDYNPATFTVAHQIVKLTKTFPRMPLFRVASWNHLFEIETDEKKPLPKNSKLWKCEPEYFTEELWNEYTMVRFKETRLRKSRAHLPWERIGASQ